MDETAAALRENLSLGRWGGPLPGERVLAAQLQVSRDTIRTALRRLEAEGHVAAADQGCRRRVPPGGRAPTARERTLAMLSPVRLAELPPQALLEVDAIRAHLARNGWRFEVLTPGIFRRARPGRQLAQLVQDAGAAAWLLYQCHEPIQHWFQGAKLPCLIWGSPLPGIELPHLDTDWEAAAFHAGGLLRRNGHRRVALLAPERILAGTHAAARGLQRALASLDGANVTLVREAGGRGGLVRALEGLVRAKERATAVVASRASQAVTLLTWQAGAGLVVPRDLSLVSLADESWFNDLVPEVDRYRTDLRRLTSSLLRKISELTSGGRQMRSAPLLMPEYVPGNSVARLPPAG